MIVNYGRKKFYNTGPTFSNTFVWFTVLLGCLWIKQMHNSTRKFDTRKYSKYFEDFRFDLRLNQKLELESNRNWISSNSKFRVWNSNGLENTQNFRTFSIFFMVQFWFLLEIFRFQVLTPNSKLNWIEFSSWKLAIVYCESLCSKL